jgi:hypothetical protein
MFTDTGKTVLLNLRRSRDFQSYKFLWSSRYTLFCFWLKHVSLEHLFCFPKKDYKRQFLRLHNRVDVRSGSFGGKKQCLMIVLTSLSIALNKTPNNQLWTNKMWYNCKSKWFIAWPVRPWRWRRYIPSKLLLISNNLHSPIYKKIVLFINIAVRTS